MKGRLALWSLALLLACDRGQGSVTPAGAGQCPPCECNCQYPGAPAEAGAGGTATSGGTPGTGADVGELVASASRKMMHDDGKGCLEDLDRVAVLDPKMDARLAINRAQCEMLVGKCQEGKRRVARWYEVEMAMHPERAEIMAEQLGATRCRGGNSTPRDELLRALHELMDGAYVNRQESRWCAQRVATIRRLLPQVPPRDADDTQISGAGKALFHTAAACHARAGDCRAALQSYRELFPAQNLSGVSAAQRDKVVRESFESSIERCKGTR